MPGRDCANAVNGLAPGQSQNVGSLEAPGAYEGGQLHLVGSIRTAVHVTNGFASTASTSLTDAIV